MEHVKDKSAITDPVYEQDSKIQADIFIINHLLIPTAMNPVVLIARANQKKGVAWEIHHMYQLSVRGMLKRLQYLKTGNPLAILHFSQI